MEPDIKADLKHRFAYHPPSDPSVASDHERVREELYLAAAAVADLTPRCREQALAFTKLEEAMMWANAAIARNQA